MEPAQLFSSLPQRQQKIIELLQQSTELSFATLKMRLMQLNLSISERTLRSDLINLKEKGMLASRGQARARIWYLVKKPH